jgi:hypothetical protein
VHVDSVLASDDILSAGTGSLLLGFTLALRKEAHETSSA